MKRRIGRAAVVLATVTILFFYPFVAPPAHRIDEAHFRLIKGGMTQAEVEGIFGVRCGEYDWCVASSSGQWIQLWAYNTEPNQRWNVNAPAESRIVFLADNQAAFVHDSWNNQNPNNNQTWTSRHGVFYVVFDGQGRVIVTGTLGEARREYPWSRWWRQLTGKQGK